METIPPIGLADKIWKLFSNIGPLEWLWRMLTYGQRFPLRKRPQHPK